MDFQGQPIILNQPQDDNSQNYPLYQPPQPPIDDVTLVTQTNPGALIIEWMHKMKGQIEVDENGQKKWITPQGAEPLMNDNGIHSCLIDIYSVVNQCTILSWIDREDVENITIEVGKAVTFKLAMNWKDYELKKCNLTTVVLSITNLCYMALNRGKDQGERTFLKTAVRSSEHVMIQPKSMQSMGGDKKFWEFWK